jgi:hypothetical protein
VGLGHGGVAEGAGAGDMDGEGIREEEIGEFFELGPEF